MSKKKYEGEEENNNRKTPITVAMLKRHLYSGVVVVFRL